MNYRPCDEHAKEDVALGLYEQIYQIKPGDCVVDLGANVGFFTVLAADKVGASGIVHSFEPNPENFSILQSNTWNLTNVRTYNLAAWSCCETRSLYLPGDPGGCTLLWENSNKVNVRCVDIGMFLRVLGISPDYCKIDTEGAEAAILSSLFYNGILPKAISLEIHTSELFDSVKKLGADFCYTRYPKTDIHLGSVSHLIK